MVLKIAQQVTRYLGYLCKKFFCLKLSKWHNVVTLLTTYLPVATGRYPSVCNLIKAYSLATKANFVTIFFNINFSPCFYAKSLKIRAVVVVKWSACSPSTPTIRVQIPLKLRVFSVEFVFDRNENKQKEARVGPFFKKTWYLLTP